MSELVLCLIAGNYYQVTTIIRNYEQDQSFLLFKRKKKMNLIDMPDAVINKAEGIPQWN